MTPEYLVGFITNLAEQNISRTDPDVQRLLAMLTTETHALIRPGAKLRAPAGACLCLCGTVFTTQAVLNNLTRNPGLVSGRPSEGRCLSCHHKHWRKTRPGARPATTTRKDQANAAALADFLHARRRRLDHLARITHGDGVTYA